ncbi:energy-coupling factor transporter ATPase [Lactobacillaceae bacterium L1_55_11]|nr:energy-coupling factor transporter ATPase [Lactobacillaceae bacterium L1_55_11]
MAINFEQVNFSYGQGKLAQPVLKDISASMPSGEITAIVGQTGSGKSTLVQHINGLLKPDSGRVVINDFVLTSQTKEKDLVKLRAQVGMVFQFPENQLFAETVLADVAYGPVNFGMGKEAAQAAAKKALQTVGIPEDIWDKSPFALSGGQMRRVAIAGVLATDPEIVVMDEPVAGLDPKGQADLLNLIENLKGQGKTIVLITHQMEQVAALADWVVVLHHGEVAAAENPLALFNRPLDWYQEVGIDLPRPAQFAEDLHQGGWPLGQRPLTVKALASQINQEVWGDE